MNANGLGDSIGAAYGAVPLAAIFAPLFLGLIADRLFSSQVVMGALMLLSGVLLCIIPSVASGGAENATGLYWLILINMLCFMPTLGLGNTIAFTHIKNQQEFPKIRVWGTIGWIAAGLTVGIAGWSNSFNIFWLAAISSLLLGAFCFFLPNTPPPLKGKPLDVRSLLMVDAFKLLKDFNFLVFAVCSTLICIPLAYYYGQTGSFLEQTGFSQAAATMTLGQMSEIVFMLLIPFFFRRLGLKIMILVGMGCWVVRYLMFSLGAAEMSTWVLLVAVAIHGICYDFFFVTGFMYTDQKAPEAIRGQAQGLLVFLTQGIGMYIGYAVMGGSMALPVPWPTAAPEPQATAEVAEAEVGTEDAEVEADVEVETGGYSLLTVAMPNTIGEYGGSPDTKAYAEHLKALRESEEPVGFIQSFGKMFSRELPADVDQQLLDESMSQWKAFWVFPAILAGAVMILFGLTFWDKAKPEEDSTETSVA